MNRTTLGFVLGLCAMVLFVAGVTGQDQRPESPAQTPADVAAPKTPAAPAEAETPEAKSAEAPRMHSRVLRLKHARADVLAELLSQLYGGKESAASYGGRGDSRDELLSKEYRGENVTIGAEMVTNSLLVSASQERLAEIEALVERLDQVMSERDLKDGAESTKRRKSVRLSGTLRSQPQAVDDLRAQYERLESEAAQFVAQFGRVSAGEREAARSGLRNRVAAAFAARQALQRAEMEELRERFARIERQIESRERIREEIIDRRVEELLDPNLQWAPEGSAAAPQTSRFGASSITPPASSDLPVSSSEAQILERVQALEASADAETAPERKAQLLQAVAAAYEQIYLKHRSQVLGLYARLYQARCLEKLGEHDEAQAIYSQLGWKPGEAPAKSLSPADESAAKPSSDGGRSLSTGFPRETMLGPDNDLNVLEVKLAAAEAAMLHLRTQTESGLRHAIDLQKAEAEAKVARLELERARRDHRNQEQLLRLDLEAAQLRVQGAKAVLDEAESVNRRSPAAVSQHSLAERRVALQQAELEVRRAQTLLEAHFQKAAERPQLERPDASVYVGEADLAKLSWELLGLKLEPVDPQSVDTGAFRGGMAVLEVLHNGPAHKAGLRVADILVGLHTWETVSKDNLAFVLRQEILREGNATSSGVKAYALRDGEVLSMTLAPDRRAVSPGRSTVPEVGR